MTSYTLLSCIDSRIEHLTKFYGRFELGPFAPGQALTVANALRRSLLSQLSGTAITLVEVRGASNEYEILNGVRESVLDILLNLKQIVLASDFEIFSPQIGFLNVEGPGVIRANDLKIPSFISVVDPNQYIATLTTKGRLNLKFLICCGKNYITYNPSDSQYSEWLSLLKKEKPLINLNNKKTLENSFAQIQEESKKDFTISKEIDITMNFYNQWKKERNFLKSGSDSFKDYLDEENFFQENNKNFQTLVLENHQNGEKKITNLQKLEEMQSPKENNSTKDFEKKSLPLIEEKQNQIQEEINEKNLLNRQNFRNKIGYFPIDANFMPIIRVNYLIESNENLRLPQDRLILEIWTNGSIHPRYAIHKAAKALIQLFLPLQQMRMGMFQIADNPFFEINRDDEKTNTAVSKKHAFLKKKSIESTAKKVKKRPFDSRILELDIGNLELTARPYSCLKMANINTIQDLISYSKEDLLSFKNFGQRSLYEVERALRLMKLTLK